MSLGGFSTFTRRRIAYVNVNEYVYGTERPPRGIPRRVFGSTPIPTLTPREAGENKDAKRVSATRNSSRLALGVRAYGPQFIACISRFQGRCPWL